MTILAIAIGLKLGSVEPSLTMLFQIMNMALWILIIFLIYRFIKKFKLRRINLEARLRKCEDEIEVLKNRI